ncbi:hypothetical protein BGZ94_010113 [Podila epigama]|nr:hypothetical protein BGZ94_010113 [Podila epigama]
MGRYDNSNYDSNYNNNKESAYHFEDISMGKELIERWQQQQQPSPTISPPPCRAYSKTLTKKLADKARSERSKDSYQDNPDYEGVHPSCIPTLRDLRGLLIVYENELDELLDHEHQFTYNRQRAPPALREQIDSLKDNIRFLKERTSGQQRSEANTSIADMRNTRGVSRDDVKTTKSLEERCSVTDKSPRFGVLVKGRYTAYRVIEKTHVFLYEFKLHFQAVLEQRFNVLCKDALLLCIVDEAKRREISDELDIAIQKPRLHQRNNEVNAVLRAGRFRGESYLEYGDRLLNLFRIYKVEEDKANTMELLRRSVGCQVRSIMNVMRRVTKPESNGPRPTTLIEFCNLLRMMEGPDELLDEILDEIPHEAIPREVIPREVMPREVTPVKLSKKQTKKLANKRPLESDSSTYSPFTDLGPPPSKQPTFPSCGNCGSKKHDVADCRYCRKCSKVGQHLPTCITVTGERRSSRSSRRYGRY